jgi:hypothetical protein
MATLRRILSPFLVMSVTIGLAACGDPGAAGPGAGPEMLDVTDLPATVQDEDLALVRDIRLDAEGRVWVLSGHPPFVRIYEEDGARVAAFGQPGGGPAEFGAAWALVPPVRNAVEEGADGMGVFDNRRGTIRTFAPDGTILAEERLDTFTPLPPDTRQVFFGDLAWVWRVEGGLLQDRYPAAPEVGPMPMSQAYDFWQAELAFLPDDGGEPRTLVSFPEVVDLPDEEGPAVRPLSAGPLWDLCPGGEFVVLTRAVPELIRVGLDGRILSRDPVELSLAPLDQGLLVDWMVSVLSQLQPMPGDTPEGMRYRAEAAAERAADYMDPTVPPTRLRCDPDGRVWIQLFDMEDDRRGYARDWVVVDSEGELVAEVTFPVGFHPMRFGSERIVGVVRDELDVETVGWLPFPEEL